MTAEEKLDRIGAQLAQVSVQQATLLTRFDGLATDVTRIAAETAHNHADHEVRLRALESRRETDHAGEITDLKKQVGDLKTEVSGLQRIRWMVTGAAFALGGGGGALVTKLLT